MRFVLADLRGERGVVTKDTVAGGYGSRLVPFSRTTKVYCFFKRILHDLPSIQMGYVAAILAAAGHQVVWTRDKLIGGDMAIVLSSLVDYRREVAWADAARQRGMRVGFIGLAASKLPELFAPHADFVIGGEPEQAVERLARGESLAGIVASEAIADLDSLPVPHWYPLIRNRNVWHKVWIGSRPIGGGFPLLGSRSCPEFCTYCPHRIMASYRSRSVSSIVEELEYLCRLSFRQHVVFRDPLFTQDRQKCLSLCEQILTRRLRFTFECETRLDCLDEALLERMHAAGLRLVSFGVESIATDTLRRVARRPIPEAHQRAIVEACRKRGITTAAYYVFGFLQDTWESVAATIEYAISLGSTLAQFKLLTPYPGTPLWKQLGPLVYETDWEKFNGYTPTFHHPNLGAGELRFLLGAAYARFYSRPSWLANYFRIEESRMRAWVNHMDRKALATHARQEMALASRSVTC